MIINNHKNFRVRLSIDYQYQSINWYWLSSIVIDCHRLSILSIVQVLVHLDYQNWPTFKMTPGFKISSFNYKILPFNLQSWALLLKQDERDGHISQASLKHSSAPSRFPCSARSTPIASSSFALRESSLLSSLMSFSFLGCVWEISPRGSKGLKILSKTAWSVSLVAILFIEPRSQGIKALVPTPVGQSFTRQGSPGLWLTQILHSRSRFSFILVCFNRFTFILTSFCALKRYPWPPSIPREKGRVSKWDAPKWDGKRPSRPGAQFELSPKSITFIPFPLSCSVSRTCVWKNSAFSRLWTIQLESIFLLFHLR